MADGDGIPPAAVINLVFFALLFNVVMALSFAVVSGYATLRGYPFGDLFGAAAGFLGLERDRIQPEIERIFDPGTGNSFNRADDYTMDDQSGSVTAFSSGPMGERDVESVRELLAYNLARSRRT